MRGVYREKDDLKDFVIGSRRAGPAMVWYRRNQSGWTKYLIDDATLGIEAGGAFYDIDGDGDLNIISIGWSNSRVLLYENKASHCGKSATYVPIVMKVG